MILLSSLNVLNTFQPYHMRDQACNQRTISIHNNPVWVLWVPLIHRRHLPRPAIGPGLLSSPVLFYFLLVDARQTQSGFLMNTLHPSWGLWESLPGVNPAMMWMSHNSQAHLVSWLLSYCFPKWLYWLTLLSAMLGSFCFPMASAAPGMIRCVHLLQWSR